MTITTEEAELQRHHLEEVRLLSLAAERDAFRAESARLREVLHKARAKYIALDDKDAAEAMAKIITEALGDDK